MQCIKLKQLEINFDESTLQHPYENPERETRKKMSKI